MKKTKNTRGLLAVIAIAAVISAAALSMTGCPEPDATPTLVSIAVTTTPTKLVYIIGETFDATGMVVTGTYSDETTKAVTDYTNNFDSSAAGTIPVTISYQGKDAAPFNVTVNRQAVSIAITTPPTKVVYAVGEALDVTGLVVTATYNDGDTAAVSGYAVSTIDTSTPGPKPVTVTYQGFEAYFTVNVYDGMAVQPTATPAAGNYNTEQSVTLATTTEGASIYYTTDGTDPVVAANTEYTAAIPITGTTTLKAMAVKAGMANSTVLTAQYYLVVSKPSASLAAGTFIAAQSVTLSTTTAGTTIFYTTDGSTPSATNGTQYATAIPISETTTLKAIAVKAGWTNSDVLTVQYNFDYTSVTLDTWYDGTAASGADKWFKFTATATTTYIHFLYGTSSQVTATVYQADGTTALTAGSSSTSLSASSSSIYRTTVIGNDYYIKVSYTYYPGAYKIGVNNQTWSPVTDAAWTTPTATPITNTWVDGNIATAGGEQWFKFDATAATHVIHFYTGTLFDAYVILYDENGRTQVGRTELYGTTLSTSRANLTSGNTYYIKVMPGYSTYSGTYKIAVATTTTPPPVTIPSSPAPTNIAVLNTWTALPIASVPGEVWYKYTTTAVGYQYIYFDPGSLKSVYVQIYDSSGAEVGNKGYLSTSTTSIYRGATSTPVATYYIRVTTFTDIGTASIAVTTGTTTTIPTQPALDMTAPEILSAGSLTSNWADGNITTEGGEEWFTFSATATSHSIYFRPGTLNRVYVRLYADTGAITGGMTALPSSATNSANIGTSRSTNSGTTYYIRVTPYDDDGKGTYKIGIAMPAAPAITTFGQWVNGNIIAPSNQGGEQWYSFTATTTTHYIHILPGLKASGGLNDVYVQLYTESGATTGTYSDMYSTTGQPVTVSRTVTSGTKYYVRVWPYYATVSSGSSFTTTGTFKIAVSTSSTPPATP